MPLVSAPPVIVRGGGLASYGLRGQDNMEDTFFIHESLDVVGGGGSAATRAYGRVHVYGVADGHAGPGAAVFVQDHFVQTLLSVLEEGEAQAQEVQESQVAGGDSGGAAGGTNDSDTHKKNKKKQKKPITMPDALREAFLRVDAAFVQWAAENDDASGCALVVCVVVGGTIYVANAGDCRAVVGRKECVLRSGLTRKAPER